MMRPVHLTLAAVCLVTWATAGRTETGNLAVGLTGADIADVVTQALAEQGYAANVRIARERRFYPCDHTPGVAPMFNSWDTVAVRCDTPQRWQIAVRTDLAPAAPVRGAETPLPGKVLVVRLRSSLKRGEVIKRGDVELVAAGPAGHSGYFTDPADVIGRKMKNPVGSDTILLARHLVVRWMVEKGDPVTLEIADGSIHVATPGRATENGQFGDTIAVRSSATGRIVRGRVQSAIKIAVHANMN